MRDLLRLVRAANLLIALAGVLAGGWIALGRVAIPRVLAFAALAAASFAAAGNVLNDLWDAPADRLNRRPEERPLAAGRIAPGTAHLTLVASVLGGVGAAALVSGTALLIGLGALAVMIAYSPLLKRRGVPGNLAIAAVAGLPPLYGALAVDRPAAGVVPWTLAAWLHLVRELVKDIDDAPGDRAVGRRTLPLVVGTRAAQLVAAGLAAGFVPLSLVLPAWAHYGRGYFLIALVPQLAVLGVASWLAVGRTDRASVTLKGAMLVGLVALVAGRVA